MPINPNLLVSAAMLQDYIVDKDCGKPLANGIISLYVDTARTFFKNWYYQTGTPGAYTYIPLDNPLHLSSVGTIMDPNGNDVIPFYYPFDENDENVRQAYYITVYSSDRNGNPAILQFTRENFPFEGSGINPGTLVPSLDNVIVNNVFWRNIGAFDATTILDKVVAPSQHDGYTNPDIRFLKNVAGATDAINFLPMTQTLNNDITPEVYLNAQCTAIQTGETQKCIQYPVSLHVDTLQNVSATLTIQAQNISGNTNNYLDLYVYQFLGTGALSQPPPILIQRIILNNTFQKFVIPFIFPDAAGLTLGGGGDDALFIQVQYPLSSLFQINHTKVSVYLSDTVPDNDFQTYDEIETIINSPRTGDFRQSFNTFVPYGWVNADNGFIGSAASMAPNRANIDTWPLYNIMWTKYNVIRVANLPNFNYLQIQDSTGTATTYGSSAIADFNANKRLQLVPMLNGVIAATNPNLTLFTFTVSGNSLVVSGGIIQFLYTGSPIIFTTTGTLPTGLSLNTVYYSIYINTTTIQVATTEANAFAGTNVTISSAGTGVNTINAGTAGTSFGESMHVDLIGEMPTHNHPPISGNGFEIEVNSGGTGNFVAGTLTQLQATTGNAGSGLPHNNMQPSIYYNVYMKL